MGGETINWYPGHMKKATRMMEDSLRLVDAVVELLDARIPNSSRNPDVERIVGSKPRLIVLNRADQADAAATAEWKKALSGEGVLALEMDCKSGRGVNAFPAAARSLLREKIERAEAKGQVGKALRFMVLGVPNVGKSSFINRLAGRKAAETSDRPGVTRGKQWITLNGGILLLDTPGILWPKFEYPEVGMMLAYTGAVKEGVIDLEELAYRLMELLHDNPCRRFGIPQNTGFTVFDLNSTYQIDPADFLSAGKATPFTGWNVEGRCLLTSTGETIAWYDADRLPKGETL